MATNTGILRMWNFERGYGFIYERVVLLDGKVVLRSYFAHISRILSGEPIVDSVAHFNVAPSGKADKPAQAVDIEFEPVSQAKGNGGSR
jgi:hypothetical protein